MKVLMVNTLYPPPVIGGAELSVQSLAETLVKKGVQVVTAGLSPDYTGLRHDSKGEVRIYDVRLKNVYWPFQNLKTEIKRFTWHTIDIYNPLMACRVEKIAEREKPDVIHTHNLSGFSTSIWHMAQKLKIPLLHTIRDYYLLCHLSTMYRHGVNCCRQCLRCQFFSHPKRFLSKVPIGVTAISQFILDRHLSEGFFPGVKFFGVVPNGYRAGHPVRQTSAGGKLRLGYLGRITPEKGLERLLKTLKRYPKCDVEVHIAGKGSPAYLSRVIQNHGDRIIYHGFVEPGRFFSKVDALVVPSLWNEPFGRTIIESFAYGVPVIGSKRGAIPELIDEGNTGYLYEPENSDSLLDVIRRLTGNSARIRKMRESCFKQSSRFLPESIADRYLTLYDQMLRQQ